MRACGIVKAAASWAKTANRYNLKTVTKNLTQGRVDSYFRLAI